MSKFRKKPVVIEAEQWFEVTYDREAGHGNEPEDMPIYHLGVGYFRRPDVSGGSICSECGFKFHVHGYIATLEDGHRACPGDWIITGIRGEKYPCKPDIFEATYEKVEKPPLLGTAMRACCEEKDKEIAALKAEVGRLRDDYNDLTMEVSKKYPDETRHQTAKRYIRLAERGTIEGMGSGGSLKQEAPGRSRKGDDAKRWWALYPHRSI